MRKKPRTNSFMSAHEDEVTLTQSQPRPQIVVGEGGQWTPLTSTQRTKDRSTEITARRRSEGDKRTTRPSTQRSGAQSIEVTVRRGQSEGGPWAPRAPKQRSEATTVEITVPNGRPARSSSRSGRSRRGAV